MKQSLTLKMFVLTLLSFMILITSIFLFNSLYFTKVYEQRKISNIVSSMNNFANALHENNWSEYELYRQTDIFYAVNNVQIEIVGSKDQLMYFPYYPLNDLDIGFGEELTDGSIDTSTNTTYLITVKDNKENFYDMYIDSDEYNEVFSNKEPFKGDKLSISGYIEEDFIINAYELNGVPIIIEDNEKTGVNYSNDVYLVKVDNLSFLDEKVDTYNTSVNEQEMSELVSSIPEIYSTDLQYVLKVKDGVKYTIEDVPYTNSKQVTFIKSAVDYNGREVVLLAYASLQPVNEAVGVVKEYYIYFYILAGIISIIVALIYSRLVSKPLVKLSQSASRMANMDFTDSYVVKSSDELGLLSRSLNTMSSNLEKSLEQLKAANKQLKLDYEKEVKQEKARKEFVANVSHELKTPLGIIRGFAEGIKDGIKKEKRDYYIDVILDEVEKMNELIMEMLELSRLEAGVIKLNKESFDVQDLIKKTTSIFELPISDKKLNININGIFRNIYADKSKIEQVLVNLIGNAIKHSIDDSEIIVYGEIIDNFNYVYIKNKCKQMSDEELERIWDRFYKTDKSHNRDSGGTGLGLAIVRAILEAHNSDFGVKKLDDGVIFYFGIELNSGDS